MKKQSSTLVKKTKLTARRKLIREFKKQLSSYAEQPHHEAIDQMVKDYIQKGLSNTGCTRILSNWRNQLTNALERKRSDFLEIELRYL